MQKRPIFSTIMERLQEPRRFIQVLLGPRQVGKTTLMKQATANLDKPFHFVSADTVSLQPAAWLEHQWEIARKQIVKGKGGLLIVDEVQKIPHWSDLVKALWDEDTHNDIDLSVVLLGSSPWLVQQGLTESLAGRCEEPAQQATGVLRGCEEKSRTRQASGNLPRATFEIIPITHWSFAEMHSIFGWSLEKYAYFGGYPGAVPFVDEQDQTRWKNYVNDSLIETTISRDVLLMTHINKPVLLRRLFQLGCDYSGQVLAYTKMLGQLQEHGNTTTIAHYLELLAGAGLVDGLQKFSSHKVRQRGSSPKLMVYNTALMNAQTTKTFHEATHDHAYWGRVIESVVGAHLLNSIRGTQMKLFYWREGDKEVDFILQHGDRCAAIEVKSSQGNLTLSGIDPFVKQYHPNRILLVGNKGIPLTDFLTTPLTELVK